MYTEGTT